MPPSFEAIVLPPTVFTILRDLVLERTGIYFSDDRRQILAEKLSSLVTECGFPSFLDYYYLLKYGPEAETHWPNVVDALSVQETYFWREMDQIHALVQEILPTYVRQFPNRPIQIWCAACATGEEPLTIAMALQEQGWFERASISIKASDASPAAISKARGGQYRERSFRALSKTLQEKYFSATPGGWRVSDELLGRVEFARANLMNHQEIEPFARSPFIFCRNVFIYFSDAAIARTVRYFAQSMQRPGHLFVGASESLLKLSTQFELQSVSGAFLYQVV